MNPRLGRRDASIAGLYFTLNTLGHFLEGEPGGANLKTPIFRMPPALSMGSHRERSCRSTDDRGGASGPAPPAHFGWTALLPPGLNHVAVAQASAGGGFQSPFFSRQYSEGLKPSHAEM